MLVPPSHSLGALTGRREDPLISQGPVLALPEFIQPAEHSVPATLGHISLPHQTQGGACDTGLVTETNCDDCKAVLIFFLPLLFNFISIFCCFSHSRMFFHWLLEKEEGDGAKHRCARDTRVGCLLHPRPGRRNLPRTGIKPGTLSPWADVLSTGPDQPGLMCRFLERGRGEGGREAPL